MQINLKNFDKVYKQLFLVEEIFFIYKIRKSCMQNYNKKRK